MKRINQTEMMYPEQEFTSWSLQTHFGRYSFASGYVKAKNVLDLGCGSGYGSSFLSKSGGADHVIGGDVSENAIKAASSMFQNNKLSFVWLDATALPFRNDSFDIVVSLEVIEHLVEYRIYLQEVKRVLRSHGTFICSTPNRGFVSWDPRRPGSVYHKKEFNISEFKEILSEYFPKLTMFGQDYWKSAERGFSRVIDMMSWVVFSLPRYQLLTNFFSKLPIWRGYERLTMANAVQRGIKIDHRYIPFPLTQTSPIPRQIIAVARKSAI